MSHNHTGIAPAHTIQRDFRELDAAERLRTNWETERLILIQSVQGHAHEGHCAFKGIKYPNTSIDAISRALHLDPQWVREQRQILIDEISAYADEAMAGGDHLPLANSSGEGLLGSSMFRTLDVPPHDVLRGLYLGGLRDTTEIRFEMEARYGITIGGGKSYIVDTRVMEQQGLDGEVLAHGSHEDMLDYYRDIGLIVADSGEDDGDLEYMYIRHRRGTGASDDMAIVMAGLLYGLGTAIGVFLADAIDTLEKHVPIFSDQDVDIARKIKKGYARLDVTDKELRHLTYLSAAANDVGFDVPDSSLRRLMLIDRKHDLTPVESHLLFVQGKRFASITIGVEEILNRKFYDYVQERLRSSPVAV